MTRKYVQKIDRRKVIDVAQLKDLVEVQKLQQWKVAEMMGLSRSKMSKFCHRYGIQTQRTGPRSGEGHPQWKGGPFLIGGYWHVYCPDHPNASKNHRMAEHRLVMEEKLGRYLERKEVVHHIDGNRLNNHPDNLIVFPTNAQHLKEELTGNCPNWTPEGFACMCKTRPQWRRNDYLKAKYGDDPQALPTDHQT